MHRYQHSRCRKPIVRGFTLIEVMVVVLIIGLLASLVAPKVMKQTGKAFAARTAADVNAISSALELYHLDHHRYPSTSEGLAVLNGTAETTRYLSDLPVDPWGNSYHYRYPGNHGDYDVWSYGADGSPGGSGDDSDVGNWRVRRP